MMKFDHIGLVTDEKNKGDTFVEATKVWVSNPHEHPFKIEWLRFEADSPASGPVRNQPHAAFRVDNLKEASLGLEVLLQPFDVGYAMVGFYMTGDGAVIELMEYKDDQD